MSIKQIRNFVRIRLNQNFSGPFWSILIISLALISCSPQKTTLQNQVYFMDLGTPEEIARMTPLLKEFEHTHPDIKVKVEYVSGGTYEKFLVQLVGGSAPDVVYMNDTAYPDLVERGAFQPLDEFISKDNNFNLDDFRSEALKFGTISGKIYFLPPTSGTIIIYYNRALFKEAGIPYPNDGWVWEEFREICKKLTVDKDGDGKIDQYALAGWGLLSWYPMILQNRGKIISEDGRRSLLNNPEAIEALEFVKRLYTEDKVIVSEAEVAGMVQMGATAMMAMGKTAMLPSGFGAYEGFANIDWDMVAPPRKRGGRRVFHGGYFAYGIATKTKYPVSAWELVKFLTSENVQRDWVRSSKPGDMPTRKAVVADFENLFPDKSMKSYVYAANNPNYEFQIKKYRQILDILDREIEPVIKGVVPGDLTQVCNKASKEITEILESGDYTR